MHWAHSRLIFLAQSTPGSYHNKSPNALWHMDLHTAWPSTVVLMVLVITFDYFLKLRHKKKPSSLEFFDLSTNPNTDFIKWAVRVI